LILLDTHILVWWINGSKDLSTLVRRTIENARAAKDTILVSAISAWEIAMLVQRGRLSLDRDVGTWLEQVALIDDLNFVAVDRAIAIDSVRLPGEFHKDPADRIIVATARKHAASVLTADAKIIAYPNVKTIRNQ
jgi:PIN domain nuclease of toxin-antitoxin system